MTDRLIITPDGKVGVGNTNPAAKLDVNGSIGFSSGKGYLGYYNVAPYDQAEVGASGSTTSLSLVTNGISRMNIDPNGNVGIGTAAPNAKLHVTGGVTVVDRLHLKGTGGDSGQAPDAYGIYQEAGPWTSPYPDLRISYHTGISYDAYYGYGGHRFFTGYDGTGNPIGLKLQVSDQVYVTGNLVASGTVTQNSDLRLKKNILPLKDISRKIASLKGVTYDWIEPENHSSGRQMGVIAQDVEKVFPEAVIANNEGILSVSYSSLIAPLIEAVKELYGIVSGSNQKMHELEKS